MNYATFSIFAALLLTEVMAGVLLLFLYEDTKSKVLEYVVPIWTVTGTFGAFWIVTSYFAYPTLLVTVASLFAPLLIVFLILFVARNSSIVFGEFITKKGWLDEKKLVSGVRGFDPVAWSHSSRPSVCLGKREGNRSFGGGIFNRKLDHFARSAWFSKPGR